MRGRWKYLFAALLLINSLAFAQLPDNYQSLSAEEKQSLLWSEVTQSHKLDPLPKLTENSFKQLLITIKGFFNLKPSFDHEADELPQGRAKILHSNGSVGRITFLARNDHPFTGIYKTGAVGIARLSLAMPSSDTSFVPGMAVKFLIDNRPSVNIHAINSLEGQGADWNFFAMDFSNKIEHPSGKILRAIELIFEWTHDPANELGLWRLAAWNRDGQPAGIPIYPERIYFKPASNVQNLIAADSRDDFRSSLLLVSVGPLYELYGLYHGNEYHIGTIMLESELLASQYGDNYLFFQHQR
ncbi:hypothetical protein Lbir_1686 [Legionella birminghamensis]|uniref:Uncharacterized protein n=1 Tax=Legionella birminghamensis TaxID=28083 RepID=A0A378I6M7_9GAMM|nr:hypothetical protein [Legionella birminghamensis]KTC71534.1 hypothetical protein Lbir_1686 [Legionella birminghamensis]STX30858.1 Uncharacterised protein [Legionella birminghamensis]